MDARLLEILACPVCKGTLKYQRDAQLLVCRMTARTATPRASVQLGLRLRLRRQAEAK